ncbi:MAG TPA: zinc-ribbon domain-containing protein [Amycolatopsis sp.]|nr:zinc-ribbon domain-containing protein [Amycolatopsis sp.]
MIIYGWRRQVRHLTTATYLCGNCQNPSAHALRKTVTKLTLFFIPLFPISSKHFTVCTFCGATNKLTKAEAQQVLDLQQAPAQQPAPPLQPQLPPAAGFPPPQPYGAPQQFGAPQQPRFPPPGYPRQPPRP